MKLIYILVLYIYLNITDGLPQVRVRPQTAVIPSSSEAHLICESNDTPFISVSYWTHVGQRIELNPSIIEMHENELRIFQFGDTAYTQPGAYACVVSTQYGLLESEPAMLSLPTLDPFKTDINENNVMNLTEGNIAVIPCELPNGNPRPIPLFTLDNNPIQIESNSNRYKILPSGNLHIIDINQSDAGKYRCSAKNSLTEQIVNNSQITTLHVLKKPLNDKDRLPLTTVYKPPVASRVLVGNNFSIECVIAGWPKPNVEWEKYGDVLPDKRNQVLHGTLYLYDIRMDDRGTYICRATSSTGQSDIAYTALLEVLEPPKIIQRPDSVIQINQGESVPIKCGFRGRPEPIISWLYNGEEIIINGSPVTGGILSLNQAKAGIYQCIGRNPYGIAQASTVLILPNNTKSEKKLDQEVPSKKSLIVIGPNNITVFEGETIQLHCLTQTGSTVQWLHNNEMIQLNLMRRYEMLPSGGLRIVSAQKSDSGLYECVASKIGFGTNTAKCYVHIQGLGVNVPEKQTHPSSSSSSSTRGASKLEIIDINQISNNVVELIWKTSETVEANIQIQYRLIYPKTSWITDNQIYNQSVTHGIISNLEIDQVYKFRVTALDTNGKQIMSSPTKRYIVKPSNQLNLPMPQITDAWITADGHISLKWKINDSDSELIDGFIIYYRLINSKNVNYTTITIPNLRYPLIDTYTISSPIETNEKYELRMATYSNRGLSSMSNSIEISIPSFTTERRSNNNPKDSMKNLDEILENITKIRNPTHILHDLATPSQVSLTSGQKNSDMLYLTIGIIAGILLILIIILIVMCILRIFQRKKFIAHVKSVNGSEFYCDGLHKSLNPDYATTPCLQHGVVAVDGKLIPFAYPTNSKQTILWNGQTAIPHSSTTTTTDNGTIRLNPNPMNRLDNEKTTDTQDNFYHTLTPYGPHSQYEEHSCAFNQPSLFGYTSDRSNVSACPIHHRMITYPSDTFPLKTTLNKSDNSTNKKVNGIVLSSQTNGTPFHQYHHHLLHHGTCQRHIKTKPVTTSNVNENDQQQDLCDRSFSSSSAGGGGGSSGHYCTHLSNDSTRPLINSIPHQQTNDNSAPTSTGSSSHSSSGIGSSIESPYNHWKYLTPLSVTTIHNDTNNLMSDNKILTSSKEHSLTTKMSEPITISST
ncbi:unnamed protein product [Adineta steineri]|uniref:Uncharacterized protein n=1 Tax=Adineta steineri TaxID=433720 RepID=A0A814T756_9BILA|nr:unnamed protein product [Adineta steineri]